jgi:spermidine synthase
MDTAEIVSDRPLELRKPALLADAASHASVVVPLFTSTLFVSAFLLFLVQPMVAKMVLPMLGGSPMVWNTCMVFFQMALLVGYAYAHGATKWLNGRTQMALHVVLLLLPFSMLPFLIGADSAPPAESAPIPWLLMMLASAIGLPFLTLATSASVLQHWFSRTNHPSARDPYFLYVASNVGSFVALIAYPSLVEPSLSLRDQSHFWTAGYSVFAALVIGCAIFAWRAGLGNTQRPEHTADISPAHNPPLTAKRRAWWVALAFIPSSLMLAVTTYLSTDVGAVPLLWIVPLGLYLVTFIAAFSSKAIVLQAAARRMFPLLLVPLAMLLSIRATGSLALMLPLHILAFVAAALLCHTRLAGDRPAPAHLTEFYLWISFGGMLGGLFNGLAAPLLFTRVFEYPIVLALACVILPGAISWSSRRDLALDFVVPIAIGVLMLAALWIAPPQIALGYAAAAIPAVVAFGARRRPLRFAMSIGVLTIGGLTMSSTAVLHAERTFFGVYRVTQDLKGEYRALAHGTTLHGMQALGGPEQGEPLTYFHRGGPFGQAFAGLSHVKKPQDVAVIGLGVGTLAAYAQPGQQWTFYEIDEAVERIARNPSYFNYLERCGERCRVVIGDARLSLTRTSDNQYDVMVLDAFSSDSIPMHLLTSEALALYLKGLRPQGVILFHISNRHLTLAPIVGRLAKQHDLVALVNTDQHAPDWPRSRAPSIWVAMARNGDDLGAIAADSRWKPVNVPASTPLWTDDFSNILSAVHFR